MGGRQTHNCPLIFASQIPERKKRRRFDIITFFLISEGASLISLCDGNVKNEFRMIM